MNLLERRKACLEILWLAAGFKRSVPVSRETGHDNEQPASAFLLSIDEFEKSRLRINAAVAATITNYEREIKTARITIYER